MGAMPAVKVEGQGGLAESLQHLALPSPSASEGRSYGGHVWMSPVVPSPADSVSGRRRISGPVRRAKGGWTPEEDEMLRKAVDAFKGRSWKKIAESFPDRTEVQCLHRWQKVLNPALIKGPWTQEEDDTIIEMVKKHGPRKWSIIAKALAGRIGKQCRERWHNHLDPQIKKEAWTFEEELVLVNAHRLHGNKWAEIAKVLPGRTDNSIKNHWNSSVKKRLDDITRPAQTVPVHGIHTDMKHELPPVENHIYLNKDPNINLEDRSVIVDQPGPIQSPPLCSLRNIKGCSDFLSLSTPTARPVTSCETCIANDSAVALTILGLKMDSGHDKSRELNFLCEKGLEINLNENGTEIDRRTDKIPAHSESDKSESETAKNGCKSSLQNEGHNFGSLCYQIPAHSPVFSSHHAPEHCRDGFHSPLGCTTPSRMDGKKSDQPSVESILKTAADNFPGTPSILRRRKREKPTPQYSDLKLKTDTDSDSFGTPAGNCTTESPHSFKTATFLSLGRLDDQRLPAALASVDVSPAYRLRSKRMAVLKSIEKHLDFSPDGMGIHAAEILESASWNSESIDSNTGVLSQQDKKMDGGTIRLGTLTKDFTHQQS